MQHWHVCPKQLLHHYKVSRTQRLAWRHSMSATVALAFRSWHVLFKLSCIMHTVFYGTSPAYLTNIVESAVQVPASVQHRRPTTHCHSCGQSSLNGYSHMPDRLHGTHFRKICMPRQTQWSSETDFHWEDYVFMFYDYSNAPMSMFATGA